MMLMQREIEELLDEEYANDNNRIDSQAVIDVLEKILCKHKHKKTNSFAGEKVIAKMRVFNNVIDLNYRIPYKLKEGTHLMIFRDEQLKGKTVIPFSRIITRQKTIDHYNKSGDGNEIEQDNHKVHIPVDEGYVWVMWQYDDIDFDTVKERSDIPDFTGEFKL